MDQAFLHELEAQAERSRLAPKVKWLPCQKCGLPIHVNEHSAAVTCGPCAALVNPHPRVGDRYVVECGCVLVLGHFSHVRGEWDHRVDPASLCPAHQPAAGWVSCGPEVTLTGDYLRRFCALEVTQPE